jgi:hypothetical protein
VDQQTYIPRDPLCSNKEHAAFLESLIANAKRNLAKPNVRYQNGRMSHDVERETLNGATEDLHDLMLSGYFTAEGRFAGFEQRYAS